MTLTKEEQEKYWQYAFFLRIMGKVIDFGIFEKLPKKIKNPTLNNHLRKLKESADFIIRESGYSLIDVNSDYSANHSYALYRIVNYLHLSLEDELFKIANDLEHQQNQIKELGEVKDIEVHAELMQSLYGLDGKDKKRMLNLAKKIKKEKETCTT